MCVYVCVCVHSTSRYSLMTFSFMYFLRIIKETNNDNFFF